MSADNVLIRGEGADTFSPFVPTIEFDGCRFQGSIVYNPAAAPCLYLAYQARRGDAVAADALNACMVAITDVDGKTYWPMEGEG